ncbi:hypothetical protein GIB67_000465, partial [Kingdonia uniflora]
MKKLVNFITNEEALTSSSSSLNFADFPEDVQLFILSFLTPSEISTFSCTLKRFFSLCRSDIKFLFSMCDRRWGLKMQIKKWGDGQIKFKFLYNTLNRWENLIGFWRRSGLGISTLPLVFFEWGSSFITGSRVSPSKMGNYGMIKSSFLWMGLSPVNSSRKGILRRWLTWGFRILIWLRLGLVLLGIIMLLWRMTSPGGDRASRRQRRREKERVFGRYFFYSPAFINLSMKSRRKVRNIEGSNSSIEFASVALRRCLEDLIRMRIRMKVGLVLGVMISCNGTEILVLYSVEGQNLVYSIYLLVMSVTTVGNGDRAFHTLSRRLFASIWLLLSTLAAARAFLHLAESRIDKRHRQITKCVLHRDITVDDLIAVNVDHHGYM